ncbi:hypothetical protein MWU65_08640 [Cellulophaga sp. F20128]|uniref:hypothetical protein n=1 Tax=Cellulophaga sp. F20128 TaxID=2926413 RepID=UPI001FF12730|nr:hypothetical protein [Cellulophaga sp. F20128]MCK0157240.1 hypothetical protein [Cellulophaga sp. F20128]
MKTILTLFFMICIGVCAQAQDALKVQQKKVVVVKNTKIISATNNLAIKRNQSIARLYMDKNAKVNKELAFVTERNKSKLV